MDFLQIQFLDKINYIVCKQFARITERTHVGLIGHTIATIFHDIAVAASFFQYGISQMHKHLPEIKAATGLTQAPAFMPVVADYYSGMEVTVPVTGICGGTAAVKKAMKDHYADQVLVSVTDEMDDNGFIAANRLAGTNRLEIAVSGNDDHILLVATYDNLGKGASGAAIQNMNIMLGLDEGKGLL